MQSMILKIFHDNTFYRAMEMRPKKQEYKG